MTSIIVLCWNHYKDLTKPFVNSLIEYSKKKNFQLVLWDNGSTDETRNELLKVCKKYDFIQVGWSNNNLGFAGGNNAALKLANGDSVLFMNNDVVFPSSDWLTVFENAIDNEDKTLIGQELISTNTATIFNGQIQEYLNGWCIGASRNTIEHLMDEDGLFDEGFGLAYFEDVELCIRAKKKGFSLKNIDLGLIHLGSKSSADQLDQNKATTQAKRYYTAKLSILEPRQKRIVFFAPKVPYPFLDGDYEGKGVGGSEASLIQLTRSLAKLGYRVEIYNKTNTTGLFNGVYYYNISQLKPYQFADIFVLFRSYHPIIERIFCNSKIFWSCDQTTDFPDTWTSLLLPNVDHIVAISNYHKNYLIDNYGISSKNITSIDLGIKWSDYKNQTQRIKGKAIYCSVPGRGLDRLARIADEIKRQVPNFQLVITSDYRLWGLDNPDNEQYKELFSKKSYVVFLGKVDRETLVKHQLESELMIYPCNYEECFCIAALECMAAGAVPVTIDKGAVKQTVADGGIVLSTSVSDREFIQSVINLFNNNTLRIRLKQNGRAKAELHDWDLIAHQWVVLFDQLKEERMPICKYCNTKIPTDYVLQKHISKRHINEFVEENDKHESESELIEFAVLRFKEKVEIGVNGTMFKGTEIKVPFEYVDTVLQIARESYGPNIVI